MKQPLQPLPQRAEQDAVSLGSSIAPTLLLTTLSAPLPWHLVQILGWQAALLRSAAPKVQHPSAPRLLAPAWAPCIHRFL